MTVKSGPSYTTQREEARESMIALLQAFPQAAAVTGDLVAESMDWPNADIFAKRLKSLLPPGIVDEKQDPRIAQMTQQMQGMEQVINQLMADREGKQAEIQVDNRKVDIDMMNAETKRMEADIKAQEARIKAMESQKVTAPDTSALQIKQMDLNADAAKQAFEGEFEQQRIDIEQAKLALDEQKLNLEEYKAHMEAQCRADDKHAAMMAPPPAPIAAPAPDPVQVFNVQSGSKNIAIQRDAANNIVGATVDEQ